MDWRIYHSSSIRVSASVSHLLYADDTNILWGRQVAVGIPQPNPSYFRIYFRFTYWHAFRWMKCQTWKNWLTLCVVALAHFPITYPRMPPGAQYKSEEVWYGVTEKLEKSMDTWKIQYLSLGRVTWINNVLDTIPAYIMFLIPMPNNVLE